jgi:hypothetical protein
VADTPALPERLSDREIEHGVKFFAGTKTGLAFAEVRDLRRAAPVATPAEGEETEPAKKVRYGDCEVVEGCDHVHDPLRHTCGEWCGHPQPPAASPRREAPADFTAAVEEAWELLDDPAFIAGYLRGLGYQLVPDGHHVSREGQTVIDGKRYGHTGKWLQPRYSEPTPQMRPVGTEEADTDAE